MIVGIGMCMLVIGLIGIVILQIFRSQLLEGFIYNNGAGCVSNLNDNSKNCKLKVGPNLPVSEYKIWCENCATTEGNCVWDDEKKDCFPDPTYVMKDPTIPDAMGDPCDGPCESINGENKCNGCPKCISCVDPNNQNHFSGNWCIPFDQFDKETCPNTTQDVIDKKQNGSNDDTPTNDNGNSSNSSNSSSSDDDYNPSSSNDDYNSSSSPPSYCKEPCNSIGVLNSACEKCPNCKTCFPDSDTWVNGGQYKHGYCATPNEECPPGTYEKHATGLLPSTPEEREARHRRRREMIDSGDTMDYRMEDSSESANAKEKNNESKFLRDFQSIVHNELLNEQGMTTANSQQYLRDKARRRRENMKPNQKRGCPDMSEYVRKDSIPCWGCNLD